MLFIKKRKTKLVSFNTGTLGMKAHREFIESIDKKGIKIIHAYTLYHDRSVEPSSFSYVISYRE